MEGVMPKKSPERSCAICRIKQSKRDLTRIVRAEDGTVSIDPTGKKPGRGTYICHSRSCIEKMAKTSQLDHALKVEISQEDKEKLQTILLYIEKNDERE